MLDAYVIVSGVLPFVPPTAVAIDRIGEAKVAAEPNDVKVNWPGPALYVIAPLLPTPSVEDAVIVGELIVVA